MRTKVLNAVTVTVLVLTASCRDIIYETDYRNVPVYMSYEQLRKPVATDASRELKDPGKIYFKNGYIFINEEMKGIHVIDNHDPENPINTAFINIPGNMDMAIKGDILYTDSYVDLVAIDISDINNPKETTRVTDVFPYTLPPKKDENLGIDKIDETQGVVVGWEVKLVKNRIEGRYFPVYMNGWFNEKMDYAAMPMSNMAGGVAGTAFGVGGSMARFGLNGDYLYAVDNERFHIFDVKNPAAPGLESEPYVNNYDVETLFIHDDHIFIGTRTGMIVYSLKDPGMPEMITTYYHIYSCDPVVVQDHKAYVTLRGGNMCGQSENRLDILTLSDDYSEARLSWSYEMNEPYGLGIDDDILFVCDGIKGLRVFDVSSPLSANLPELASFEDIKAYDVIPFDDHLFMIGDDGFYQYNYSNLNNIYEISRIPVVKD